MTTRPTPTLVHLACAVLLAGSAAPAAAQIPVRSYADGLVRKFDPADPAVRYTVTVRGDDRRAYHVEMEIRNVADSTLALQLPNWSPGSYRITNGWRNVAGLTATDAAGRAVTVTKPDSLTWVVHGGSARTIVVRYAVGVGGSPNNRSYLGREAGLVDGPATYLYLVGRQQLPAQVRFTLPAGWRIGTGLQSTPDSTVYFAPSYDVLIDAPALVGRIQRWVFTADGTPHQIVVANDGRPVPFDTVAFVDMVRRITETAIAVFGQAPYQDYTYIFVVGNGGGLEHLNSTTIGLNADSLAVDVRKAASVTSHEYFHTWNVKRIRPAVLGPFDYTRPQRSLDLWLSEGNTSYFSGLIQLRAGLITRDGYRGIVQNAISAHHANPARLLVSPERASWTTWDGPEANDGYSISYYNQGQLLGLLLNIAIRDSTENRRSWEDVFRYLFAHYAGERGFASEDLIHATNTVSGRDFQDFFRRYVSGTDEIPWNDYLERVGWHVEFTDSVEPVDLNIAFVPPGMAFGAPGPTDRWRLQITQGTAWAEAGLRTGDVLVRVNGTDVMASPTAFDAFRALRAGDTITLGVLRGGRPLAVPVRGQPYRTTVAAVSELSNPSPRALRIREDMLAGTTDR
jgi:predicted metalloprotease with PDZ domain